MHKIDLTTNNFQMRRFIILQLVIALFVILFTYKWALGVTAVVDQNIIINLVYGFAGFIILLILHELIHRALFLLFKKDSKPMFKYKKRQNLIPNSRCLLQQMAILNYYAVTTNPIKYWLAYFN